MIGLLQRVSGASVIVAGEKVAEIGAGILVLVAVQRHDSEREVERLAERLLTYRVFEDESGRMNKSVIDLGLDVLLVPQFTLAADTKKGTRASFTRAAAPETGARLFKLLLTKCGDLCNNVQSGIFGADMQVGLTNDGPVTFWLETHSPAHP